MRADLKTGTSEEAGDSAAPNNANLMLRKDTATQTAVWNGVYYLYEYYVEDLSTGSRYPVGPNGVGNALLALAFWLPHPTENRLVFVYENNIHVQYDPMQSTTYQ